MILPQAFCDRPTLSVARDLLGRHLVRDHVVLRITEVEAYCGPTDTACHASAGPTGRNAPMFGPPGHTYVYLCYGIHHLLNVVTEGEGSGTAVLVRACEPVAGLDLVRARRGGLDGPRLLDGPGKVGAALALDRHLSAHPLFAPGGLELHAGEPVSDVVVGPRIGIGYASAVDRARPWRLAVAGSRWVGRRRGLTPA